VQKSMWSNWLRSGKLWVERKESKDVYLYIYMPSGWIEEDEEPRCT